MNSHSIVEVGEKIAIHLLAVIAGMVLVVSGLGLCVSMVGLPIGLPIGLLGVLVTLWGLFGTISKQTSSPPMA
ncbi:MAG: hypothetical protein ACP5XB_25575 [Isosphaeraceae bacterium]